MRKSGETSSQRGQGMVEFAIVFPLLLLLLLGIFEFGRVMFAYSSVIAASREGARYGAAIQDIGGGIPQYEDCQGIRDAVKRIGRFAAVNDGNITIQYSDDSGVYSTSCPPSQEIGLTDTISVTVDTSITPVTPLGNFSAIPITSSSSRTILRKVKLGESGTGAGSVSGAITDVNFKTTMQTAEETKGTITAILELNQVATDTVTIPFSVTGTAVQGTDYTISSSPATINAGQKTTTISINLINDGLDEGDEALFIGIGTPTNATKGPQDIHMVTIVDPPKVSFELASSSKSESSGFTSLKITLSKGSSQDVTIPIVLAGSADYGAGADFTINPNPVVIHSGNLSSSVMVAINNDPVDEVDETVVLGLDSPPNALLGAIPIHTLTIVDDDDPPEVSFYNANQVVSEEIGTFTTSLYLSEVSSKEITIPYTISGTTTSGDYNIHDPSPLTISAGSSTVDISMDVLEGDGWEEDETLILTLDTPSNALLGSITEQSITITESSSEPIVVFSSSGLTTTEGDQYIDIAVMMSNAWDHEVQVPFTVSGTAAEGSGQDYQISSSPLVIPVGYTQGMIRVQIQDDTLDENDEYLTLTMGTVVNGTKGSQDTYTLSIVDDDAAPEVNFSGTSASLLESSGTHTVNIDLSSSAVNDVVVPFNLSGSASQGSDYNISTTSVTIPAGSLSASFQVEILDDADFDPDENLQIDLGSPTNAEVGTNSRYTITIEDDELAPCDVGVHMLTVGTDTIQLSITNEGEAVTFTGGTVTWPEAKSNQPRLTQVAFSGSVIYSGREKPPTFSYTAWESFSSLDTTTLGFQFDGTLGTGDHIIVANFQHIDSGTTCSLTEEYTSH